MINNIQLLRAFAALNVVLLHIHIAAVSYDLPTHYLSFLNKFEWGKSGVDLFFVVSGFVMVYTQTHRPKTSLEFLKNRILRIVPFYWVLCLLFAGMFIFLPSAFRESSSTMPHFIYSMFFLSNAVVGVKPIMHVGWTLEYEMLFYTVFTVGIFFSGEKTRILFPTLVLALLAVFTNLDLILFEFVFGMLAASIYLRSLHITHAAGLFLAGIMVLASSIFLDFEMHRVFKWGIPSLCIVLAVCYFPQIKNRTLMILGDASYSIYLIQIFTIAIFYKLAIIFLQWMPNDLIALLCLVLTAIIGVFVHFAVEKPLVAAVKKYWNLIWPSTIVVG